ncbi:MAG: HAMP domain-containing sensor histidine kinase [Lautropia sp.]|nr:HAMP domain-containing sensor histidine kinase [Lautropia sp.]
MTIFLSLLASLTLIAIAVTIAWRWNISLRAEEQENRFAEALAAEVLPVAADGPERLRHVLQQWHRRLNVDFQVLDRQGRLLALAGRPFPVTAEPGIQTGMKDDPPPWVERRRRHERSERFGHGERPPMVAVIHRLSLPDERTLLIRSWRPKQPGPPISLPLALASLFVAVALAAWPVSRRITRRLESLQQTVDRQAAGRLDIRARIEGKDEVAALAQSFNRAAEQIESLVNRQEAMLNGQRQLLANASHELRSPLARIRMATELMLADPAGLSSHAEELRLNIRELDELVEEILLASRLDSQLPEARQDEPVDMVVLAAEEAARAGAELTVADGVQADMQGDGRLLRRMLRNLLENARRYHPVGGEPVLLRLLRPSDGQLRIEVLDRGRGVPEQSRERIFEPFYRVSGHSEQAGGVGLGLSLVQQIAQRHGGQAAYESRDGGGSCFVVVLPLKQAV